MTDVELIKAIKARYHSESPEIVMIDNIVCLSDLQQNNDNLTEIVKELVSFAETVKKCRM